MIIYMYTFPQECLLHVRTYPQARKTLFHMFSALTRNVLSMRSEKLIYCHFTLSNAQTNTLSDFFRFITMYAAYATHS